MAEAPATRKPAMSAQVRLTYMRVGLLDKFKKCFDWCSRSLVSLQQDWTTYGLTAITTQYSKCFRKCPEKGLSAEFP